MKQTFSALIFGLLSTVLISSVALAVDPAAVVDSNGQQVGLHTFDNAILRNINGLWFQLGIDSTGFVNRGTTLYFTQNGCSGTPLVVTGTTSDLVQPAIVTNDILVYGNPQAAQMLHTASRRGVTPKATLLSCVVDNSTLNLAPKIQFDLVQLGLVPPFSISIGGSNP